MCVHGYVQNIYTVFTQWVDKELIAIGEKAKKMFEKQPRELLKLSTDPLLRESLPLSYLCLKKSCTESSVQIYSHPFTHNPIRSFSQFPNPFTPISLFLFNPQP